MPLKVGKPDEIGVRGVDDGMVFQSQNGNLSMVVRLPPVRSLEAIAKHV